MTKILASCAADVRIGDLLFWSGEPGNSPLTVAGPPTEPWGDIAAIALDRMHKGQVVDIIIDERGTRFAKLATGESA